MVEPGPRIYRSADSTSRSFCLSLLIYISQRILSLTLSIPQYSVI